MATYEYIYIEVEDNENCDYMPMQVYEPQAEPRPISRVLLEEPDRPHGVYEVTGWSSEDDGTPVEAMYAPVSDSGQAQGAPHLRRRLGRPPEAGRAPTRSGMSPSPNQFGEPYLILLDDRAIVPGEG